MSEEHLPEDSNLQEELQDQNLEETQEKVEKLNQEVVLENTDAVVENAEETVEEINETVEEAVEEAPEAVVEEIEEVVEEQTDAVEEVAQAEEASTEEITEEPVAEEPAEEVEEAVEEEVKEETEAEAEPVAEAEAVEQSAPETVTEVAAEAATVAVAAAAVVKEEPVDTGKRWYSLRVISGKERKIKERIELEIQRSKWESVVSQVLVPSEKVYKIRGGKKVILERNILPGYILVEAFHKKFSSEIVQGITNIPNVIHFLGKTKPIPMQQSEANRMLGKVDESQEVGESLIEPYIVGETIKIIDGPFNGFVGDIKEVNDEKKKLKVIVKIFGRGTEVELNFMQVDKQS